MELYLFLFHFPVNNHFFSHHKAHNDVQNSWADIQRKYSSAFEIYLLGKFIKQKI